MLLEQAIFTSGKTRKGQGYHLVAKSPGITGDVVIALNQWCPSHSSLATDSVNAESLNFHPLTPSTFAISRTVYGGKEYSSRGGLRVATMVLVLARAEFAGYGNNPLRMARMACALGHLRWTPTVTERLALVELPDEEFSESTLSFDYPQGNYGRIVDRVLAGRPIALVAESQGAGWLEGAMEELPTAQRLDFHFTTGLKWSKQRPFKFHLMNNIDEPTRLRMKSAGVDVLSVAELSSQPH